MKNQNLSFLGIKNMLNRDEMKKIKGGCPCGFVGLECSGECPPNCMCDMNFDVDGNSSPGACITWGPQSAVRQGRNAINYITLICKRNIPYDANSVIWNIKGFSKKFFLQRQKLSIQPHEYNIQLRFSIIYSFCCNAY